MMNDKLIIRFGFLLLSVVLLLHLPFLTADPDMHLSTSRDAFTDEGLNTSQLRNYINHGQLDFMECDNLVKTPLFNLALLIPLQIFGTHLAVARITILFIVFGLIFFLLSNVHLRPVVIVMSLTTLLQYYVFQYAHFSLSEMLSTVFILSGIFYLFLFIANNCRQQIHLFLSSFFIALAYYSKIQFVYIIPLIPLVLVFFLLIKEKSVNFNKGSRTLIIAIGWMLFFLVFYIVCWYVPNRAIFNYVLNEESAGKYATLSSLPKTVAFNIVKVLFSTSNWISNTLFFACFITGCYLWNKNTDARYKILFAISTCWVFLEFHKLTMIYLPARYLVSYYFAAGFLSAVVISQLIFHQYKNAKLRYSGIALLSLFLLANAFDYFSLLVNRQFNIRNANNYFSESLSNNDDAVVLGPWAPSLTWDSRAISKPVWYHFMNDQDILQQNPALIISEPDEAESNQAYSQQGIELAAHADSIRSFKIGRWEVMAYWITPH
ncbi:MAG: hypothetical protein ABI729_09665 [Chitinophagales bacterium]